MGKKRFAGTVKGYDHVSEASRFSSDGITGHIRGWNNGIKVTSGGNNKGEDRFCVYATSGSNGGANDKLLGILVDGVWEPAINE